MKIFQILNLLSYVLCATFSSSSIGDALHENGSIYGWREQEQQQFKNWVQENQKSYNNEFEMIYRMEVFVKNYRTMKHHNEQLPKDVWGLNIFSDETSEELMDKLFMKKDFDDHYETFNEDDINIIKRDALSHNSFLQADKTVKKVVKVVKKTSATTKAEKATPKNPPSLDWLKQVTEVQQQGRCGSCWAFAVQDVVISRLAIANKNKLDQLSKTHLIDCADGNTAGCDGGSVSDAFDFINKYGTVYEKDYREYDQKEGQCSKPKGSIGYKQFKSVVGLTKFTNNDIETAMQTGPVTALMYADESWLRYTSGIINTCGYPKVSNYQHVVSFIAYDILIPYFQIAYQLNIQILIFILRFKWEQIQSIINKQSFKQLFFVSIFLNHKINQQNSNDNTQTWFAKNSWGSKWGMSGYFQVQKNGDAKCIDKIKKITYPII